MKSDAHTHLTADFWDYNLYFTEVRDSEWQWHQLGHMQICTSFQTNNHASTPPLSFLQAGCPSCCLTNSVKALNAETWHKHIEISIFVPQEATDMQHSRVRLSSVCWRYCLIATQYL